MKTPTTFEQQLALLESRGCFIDDREKCATTLSRISYYRFSAYFLPFRNEDHKTFKPGTSFTQVSDIYEFDKQLKTLIMSAVENIEVYVRTQLIYYHAHKYGALGYTDPTHFHNSDRHKGFLSVISREIESNKNVPFVKHHIEQYNGEFPLWVIAELFSLGTLSQFFANMKTPDRKALSVYMFDTHERVIRSWLQCCTSLRNICAHYGRIYFRELGAKPLTPKGHHFTFDRYAYSAIYMLKLVFPDKDKWNSSFVLPLSALIDKYSKSICLRHIGFPENWEDELSA